MTWLIDMLACWFCLLVPKSMSCNRRNEGLSIQNKWSYLLVVFTQSILKNFIFRWNSSFEFGFFHTFVRISYFYHVSFPQSNMIVVIIIYFIFISHSIWKSIKAKTLKNVMNSFLAFLLRIYTYISKYFLIVVEMSLLSERKNKYRSVVASSKLSYLSLDNVYKL